MAKGIGIDEALVKALVAIVMTMPRNARRDPVTKKETGELYTGLLGRDVTPVFRAVLRKREHPLADIENRDCDHDSRCNKCSRDVLSAHTDEAVRRGLIEFKPRGGKEVPDKLHPGRVVKTKGFVLYAKPGELSTTSTDVNAFADKILAML